MIKYINRTFFPCYIGICLTEESFHKELKKLGLKEIPNFIDKDACMHTFNNKDGDNIYLVAFDCKKRKGISFNQQIALLTHEIVHVVDFMFEDIGEKNVGKETRAYLTQYILQEFLYIIDEYRKK